MRIESSSNRIEVFCDLFEDGGETSVVTLMENCGKWTVGSSTCMPSNINRARIVNSCAQAAFEALDRRHK